MNKLVGIALVAMIVSCGQGEEKKEEEKEQVEVPVSVNTEYDYNFNAKTLPATLAMDKMSVEDTIKRVKIVFEYVTEKESDDYKFTEVIMSTLLARANEDLSYYEIPSDANQTSNVFYGIVDFSMGKKYISLRYVVDSYTQGAAHHNHSWYTLNYSLDEKRIHWLRDIFQFTTTEDSLKFGKMIGRNLEEGPLEMGVTRDSVSVFIKEDKEYWISPPLSWAEYLRTAKLNTDSLWDFFRQRPD